MNNPLQARRLASADLVAAQAPGAQPAVAPDLEEPLSPETPERYRPAAREDEQLAALFSPEMARDFRADWDAIQIGFVDDPKQAVRKADELVAQVLKSLAETFANERGSLEQAEATEQMSTENLRIALRRYRSFFQRLLSL